MGGNSLTSYGPTFSYITNKNYGILFNSTAVGHFDFTQLNETKYLFWHSDQLEGFLFVGDSPKSLVSSLSQIVGRMRVLPEWIS